MFDRNLWISLTATFRKLIPFLGRISNGIINEFNPQMPFTQKIVGHYSKQNHTQFRPLWDTSPGWPPIRQSYQSLQLAISSQEGTNPVNKDSVYMERRQLPEKNSMVNQVKTLRDIGNSHNSHHQLLRQSSVRYKSRRPWWSAPPLRTGVDHVFPKFVPRACCAQTLPWLWQGCMSER